MVMISFMLASVLFLSMDDCTLFHFSFRQRKGRGMETYIYDGVGMPVLLLVSLRRAGDETPELTFNRVISLFTLNSLYKCRCANEKYIYVYGTIWAEIMFIFT